METDHLGGRFQDNRGSKMNTKIRTTCRTALLSSVALMAALPANAQQVAQASGTQVLEEIIVTAEKRSRSLKDTATSVTIFDEDAINSRAGMTAASDIFSRLPNTSGFGKSGLVPTVRGVDGTGPAIGANAFLAGTRSRLNLQVDGRPITYNEVVNGDPQLWDVQQVEMLRGPQSTLQGRNAIGGALVIKTKDPNLTDIEVGGRLMAGDQKYYQGSGYLSVPLVTDQAALRLTADYKSLDSYLNMVPTVYGNANPEEYRATTLRGKLLVKPAGWEAFTALFTVTHSDFKGPQVEYVGRPFDSFTSPFGNGEPVHKPRATAGIGNFTLEISEGVTLENMISYTDFRFQRFALNAPAEVNGDEWIWEPRIAFGNEGDRLKGVAGAYYYDSDQTEQIAIAGVARFTDRTKTKAVYAEGTYDVSERFDITAGARYEDEHRVRFNTAGVFVINLNDSYKVFLPKFGAAYDVTDDTKIGALVQRGYNGGGAGFTFNPPFVNFAFDAEYVWNYEAYFRSEIDQRVSLTGNIFYSDYDGMQIPFDLNPDPALNSQIILNADKVETYGAELGLRWQAADGLELFGDIGLLSTDVSAPRQLIDNTELTRSPKFSGSFGAIYRHTSGFEAGFDARYSGRYFSEEINHPTGRVRPYFVANAQLAYNFEHVRLFGNVTNIFNTHREVVIISGNDTLAANDRAALVSPTRFMAGIKFDF